MAAEAAPFKTDCSASSTQVIETRSKPVRRSCALLLRGNIANYEAVSKEHSVVSHQEWIKARTAFLGQEKNSHGFETS